MEQKHKTKKIRLVKIKDIAFIIYPKILAESIKFLTDYKIYSLTLSLINHREEFSQACHKHS